MRRMVAVSVVLVLLAGCGKRGGSKGVVSGTVTYNGKKVNGGALVLYPTSAAAKNEQLTIPISQEGTFSTSGVPAGDYKIVVQPSAGSQLPSMRGMDPAKQAEAKAKLGNMQETPPTIPIPAKYKSWTTTDLTLHVEKDKPDQKLDLVLKD